MDERPEIPEPDPFYVEAGRRGARKRWGDHIPRHVRLDDLTPPQRRLVLALIAAARAQNLEKTDAA